MSINKSITPKEIESLALEFGISARLIRTVLAVESAGRGFDPKTGDILIQFEPHIFKKRTGFTILNKVDVQSKEWAAYNKAKELSWEDALQSTSWGIGQVMGFNHKASGYQTVSEMVNDFVIGEYYQVKGMLNFIKSNVKMFSALKKLDWATFAKYYNGANYAVNAYDVKLKNAYETLK